MSTVPLGIGAATEAPSGLPDHVLVLVDAEGAFLSCIHCGEDQRIGLPIKAGWCASMILVFGRSHWNCLSRSSRRVQ